MQKKYLDYWLKIDKNKIKKFVLLECIKNYMNKYV